VIYYLAYSFPSFLDRTYSEVSFLILPVINQGKARFNSFGAVGECAKRAYALTEHNAFFLTR
jgi:hypothetical protein